MICRGQSNISWIHTSFFMIDWYSLITALERMRLEYELIGFGNKAAEKLIEAVTKNKDQCMEFYEKVLRTHNRCQTSSKKRIDELPAHEEHLNELHARF